MQKDNSGRAADSEHTHSEQIRCTRNIFMTVFWIGVQVQGVTFYKFIYFYLIILFNISQDLHKLL